MNGKHYIHAAPDATKFVRELFEQHGDDVANLEVKRSSLEDTYIKMVHQYESGKAGNILSGFGEEKQ